MLLRILGAELTVSLGYKVHSMSHVSCTLIAIRVADLYKTRPIGRVQFICFDLLWIVMIRGREERFRALRYRRMLLGGLLCVLFVV